MRGSGVSRYGSTGKTKGKSNGSILSFFKKAESPHESISRVTEGSDSLFFEDHENLKEKNTPLQTPTPPRDAGETFSDETTSRYNEDAFPWKRRRTNEYSSSIPENIEHSEDASPGHGNLDFRTGRAGPPALTGSISTLDPDRFDKSSEHIQEQNTRSRSPSHEAKLGHRSSNGPFVEDSESEDDLMKHLARTAFNGTTTLEEQTVRRELPMEVVKQEPPDPSLPNVPALSREATSFLGGDGFDGMEDFIDDEFPVDGEEYMERLWMDEQKRLEFGLEENEMDEDLSEGKDESIDDAKLDCAAIQIEKTCPLCDISLAGLASEVSYYSSRLPIRKLIIVNLGRFHTCQQLLRWPA